MQVSTLTIDVRYSPISLDRSIYPPHVDPQVESGSLLGFVRQFARNPVESFPRALYHEMVHESTATRGRLIWICDPDLIEEILHRSLNDFPKNPVEMAVFKPLLGNGLLTAEGTDWRWQRQIVAPIFRRANLLELVPAMLENTEPVTDRWHRATEGSCHSIDRDMTQVTFGFISASLLSGVDAQVAREIERFVEDYVEPFSWPIIFGLARLPANLPFPGKRRMNHARITLRRIVKEIIAARQRKTERLDLSGDASSDGKGFHSRTDLLDRLLDARHPDTNESLSTKQVLDTLLTLLLAGHETTAKALTWALYLLARSKDWQALLFDEIETVTKGGPLCAAHVDELTQTEMFVKETLRLYPPAPLITRLVKHDTRLGPHHLKTGTVILIPIYALHRHHALWYDPDRFDPMRFHPSRLKTQARAQFLPFGGGPRMCIGITMARIELTTMLASFIRAARFSIPAGSAPPQPVARVTLRPRHGLSLKIFPRD